jgi:hypothetical protein
MVYYLAAVGRGRAGALCGEGQRLAREVARAL